MANYCIVNIKAFLQLKSFDDLFAPKRCTILYKLVEHSKQTTSEMIKQARNIFTKYIVHIQHVQYMLPI